MDDSDHSDSDKKKNSKKSKDSSSSSESEYLSDQKEEPIEKPIPTTFKGDINITLIRAELQNDTDTFGKMDPYVKIQLGSQVAKSKVLNGAGKQPNWKNEVLTLKNVFCHQGEKIKFWVFDKDVFSDDEIGKLEVGIDQFYAGGKFSGDLVLITKEGKYGGTLYVLFELVITK